jgi:hypothetical protein
MSELENRLVNGLVMSLFMTVVAGTSRCMAESTVRLTLVMYDRAHVEPETLAAAENTASEIFVRANVQLTWRDGSAYAAERQGVLNPPPEDPARLVITLQPESEAVRYGVRSSCGGFAFESSAIVFVRSVYSMGTISAASAATRLGYVMAHELGHILLGPNAHANAGIMRGALVAQDWQKAAQGTLAFTHSQNQQIRMWIDQRSLRSDPVPQAGATTELGARVTVQLYDYAAVPYRTLAEAEQEASRIFRKAGVELLWMQCSPLQNNACEQVEKSMRFVVKILPETMAVHLHRPRGVLGVTVQQFAFIFFDRAQGLCAVERLSLSVILGYVMAHELGHMVLGQHSHSRSGIMMQTAQKDALTQAVMGLLVFTSQQAADMRTRLRSQTPGKEAIAGAPSHMEWTVGSFR